MVEVGVMLLLCNNLSHISVFPLTDSSSLGKDRGNQTYVMKLGCLTQKEDTLEI